MPWQRRRALPETIHRWRGRNYARLQRVESKGGHSLKLVHGIRQTLRAYQARITANKPVHNEPVARGIVILLTELTDEHQAAENQINHERKTTPVGASRTPKTWNAVYLSLLKHFWKEIPHPLRQEIIRQSKDE